MEVLNLYLLGKWIDAAIFCVVVVSNWNFCDFSCGWAALNPTRFFLTELWLSSLVLDIISNAAAVVDSILIDGSELIVFLETVPEVRELPANFRVSIWVEGFPVEVDESLSPAAESKDLTCFEGFGLKEEVFAVEKDFELRGVVELSDFELSIFPFGVAGLTEEAGGFFFVV